MNETVAPWVRIGVFVVLAVPQLLIGLWALAATRNWYERFPGAGPDLVAAIPPFNEHLAADAGGGFFATGVALALATVWPRRDLVLLALATYAAFTAPHVLYHALNEAPGLSAAEDIYNTGLLGVSLLFAVVFAWAVWRQPGPSTAEGRPASG